MADGSRIAGAKNQTVLAGDDGTEVYAVAYEGLRFVQWSDGVTQNPRQDLNVQSNINVTAEFEVWSEWWSDFYTNLATFGESFDYDTINPINATATMIQNAASEWVLEVELQDNWSRIWFSYPAGLSRDFSAYRGIAAKITNTGDTDLNMYMRVEAEGYKNEIESCFGLKPGESDIVYATIPRANDLISPAQYGFFGQSSAQGFPGGKVFVYGADTPTNMTGAILLGDNGSEAGSRFQVEWLRAAGEFAPPSLAELQADYNGCINKYGQYNRKDYAGRVYSDADLLEQYAEFDADMAAHPRPVEWNRYGGWANPPPSLAAQLTATGRFHTHKDTNGRWWIVDPSGAPFLSSGMIGMNPVKEPGSPSDFSGIGHLFEELPANYSFERSNMLLRYGGVDGVDFENWANDKIVQQYWTIGQNTVGGFSSGGEVAYGRDFPYTLHQSGPGSFYYTVPSDLDEAWFRNEIRTRIESSSRLAQAKDDPWCMGVFWHNEIQFEAPDDVSSEIYYRVISEELDRFDPGLMYLGAKTKQGSSAAWTNAALYCDVVSVDQLNPGISPYRSGPWNHDVPCMIGAMGHGHVEVDGFSNGMTGTLTARQLGRFKSNYLRQHYEHPNSVGWHGYYFGGASWWKLSQTSNLMNILGLPHEGMVPELRSIGSAMYAIHANPDANTPPEFAQGSISKPDAASAQVYAGGSIANATDSDGDFLTYYRAVDGPEWLNVATNGTLSGTPGAEDGGKTNRWTVYVEDGNGGVGSAILNIYVDEQPAAPVFLEDPIFKPDAYAGTAYTGETLAGSATDANGDPLTYSVVDGPDWLSVAPDGVLSGTAGTSAIGTNSWTVQVDDGFGGTDTATLKVVVRDGASPIWSEDFSVDPNADRDYRLANIPTEHPRDKWIFQNDVPGWNVVDQHLSLPDGLRGAGIAISSGYFTQTGTYTLKFSHEAVGGVPATDSLAVNVYEGHASNSVYTLDLRAASCGNATATAPGTISLLASTNSLSGDQAVTQYELEFDYNTPGMDIVLSIWRDRADVTTSGDMYVDELCIYAVGSASPYDTWSGAFGLFGTNAAPLVDVDLDGWNNLLEYALNGNPTNPALTGMSPMPGRFLPEGGTNWIEYIHLERTTPGHGLTYTIEQTPDLVDTSWSNSADAVVAGEGTLNSDFKTVTNKVPMAGKSAEFLRLRVDQE